MSKKFESFVRFSLESLGRGQFAKALRMHFAEIYGNDSSTSIDSQLLTLLEPHSLESRFFKEAFSTEPPLTDEIFLFMVTGCYVLTSRRYFRFKRGELIGDPIRLQDIQSFQREDAFFGMWQREKIELTNKKVLKRWTGSILTNEVFALVLEEAKRDLLEIEKKPWLVGARQLALAFAKDDIHERLAAQKKIGEFELRKVLGGDVRYSMKVMAALSLYAKLGAKAGAVSWDESLPFLETIVEEYRQMEVEFDVTAFVDVLDKIQPYELKPIFLLSPTEEIAEAIIENTHNLRMAGSALLDSFKTRDAARAAFEKKLLPYHVATYVEILHPSFADRLELANRLVEEWKPHPDYAWRTAEDSVRDAFAFDTFDAEELRYAVESQENHPVVGEYLRELLGEDGEERPVILAFWTQDPKLPWFSIRTRFDESLENQLASQLQSSYEQPNAPVVFFYPEEWPSAMTDVNSGSEADVYIQHTAAASIAVRERGCDIDFSSIGGADFSVNEIAEAGLVLWHCLRLAESDNFEVLVQPKTLGQLTELDIGPGRGSAGLFVIDQLALSEGPTALAQCLNQAFQECTWSYAIGQCAIDTTDENAAVQLREIRDGGWHFVTHRIDGPVKALGFQSEASIDVILLWSEKFAGVENLHLAMSNLIPHAYLGFLQSPSMVTERWLSEAFENWGLELVRT